LLIYTPETKRPNALEMKRMFFLPYSAIAARNGFYYEFMVIEADCRESKETARYLVDENWEFDARLLALKNEVFEQ
jgi:hypothetical protein